MARLCTFLGSTKANFGQCVVAALAKSQDAHQVRVKVDFASQGLILTPGLEQDLVLRHPPFCPVLEFDSSDKKNSVAVSSAMIIQSCDNKVLITRRPKHMRTFPNVWVPPGGGCEEGETILEAGIREVREETGLTLEQHNVEPLCLWESVYPPLLIKGKPSRHTVVVYFLARLGVSAIEAMQNVRLDTKETNACAWLDVDDLNVATDYDLPIDPKKTIEVYETDEDEQLKAVKKSLQFLRAEVPLSSDMFDVERISTGTRFALEQFLAMAKSDKESLDKIMMAYADLSSNAKGASFRGPALKDVQVKKSSGSSFQPSQKARDWSNLEITLESAFGTSSSHEDEFSDFVGPTPIGARLASFQDESPVHLFKQPNTLKVEEIEDDDFGDFAAPPPPPPKIENSSIPLTEPTPPIPKAFLPPIPIIDLATFHQKIPIPAIGDSKHSPLKVSMPTVPLAEPELTSSHKSHTPSIQISQEVPIAQPCQVSSGDKYSALRDLLSLDLEPPQMSNEPSQISQQHSLPILPNLAEEDDDDFGDFVSLPVVHPKQVMHNVVPPEKSLLPIEDLQVDDSMMRTPSLVPMQNEPTFQISFNDASIKNSFVPWLESSPPPMLPDDDAVSDHDDIIRHDIVDVEPIEAVPPSTANWQKIISCAKKIFQNALDTFTSIEDPKVRIEVLDACETVNYAKNLSQIHQILSRLPMESHEELLSAFQIWSLLKAQLPGLLHDHEATNPASGFVTNKCKICLKEVHLDAKYHSNCANFWLHIVSEPLPT